MFDFKKLCTEVENLSKEERTLLTISESKKVLLGLTDFSFTAHNPVEALAAFIIGAVASDGVIDEKEYLLIFPSLVKAFGEDFDYESVKNMFKNKRATAELNDYINALMQIITSKNEELKTDIVTLCLLVVAIDGKISPKERRYIRRLCK